MNSKNTARKTLAWAYSAVAAFTALSVIVPIILERQSRKQKR